MTKKIMSIALILIIISNFCILSYAENSVENFIFSDSNATTVSVGSIIKIPVSIKQNSGIMGFKILINYDTNVLKPISIERGEVTQNGMINDNIGVTQDSEFCVIWSDNKNSFSNGIIFYINFTVLQTTEENTIISLSYSQDDTFNENWEDVKLSFSNIMLKISGQSANPDEPIIEPPTTGKTVIYSDYIACDVGLKSIPVYIKNNSGLMGYKLRFDFDSSVIEPVSVTCSKTISGAFDSNVGINQDFFSVVWNNTENYSQNGLLFTLVINVKSIKETTIKISYTKEDTFNESWEEVELYCNSIKVNFKNIISQELKIDYINRLIFGLTQGSVSIDEKVEALNKNSFSVSKSNKNVGTGSVLSVLDKDNVSVEEFTVILFGDVNGDGWYDGQDAVIVNMLANGMLTREQVGEAVWMAADCNRDGVINQLDVELLNRAGLLLSKIDQTKSTKEPCLSI